jgi:hypothetical protein
MKILLTLLILNLALMACGDNKKPSDDKNPQADKTPPSAPGPEPEPEQDPEPDPKEDSGDAKPKPIILDPKSSQLSPKGVFRAKFEWTTGPLFGESAGILTISAPEGHQAKSIEELKFVPWMKAHGHGTGRVQPTLKKTKPFQWKVDTIHFIMSGSWELNVTAKVDGVKDTLEIPVEVP